MPNSSLVEFPCLVLVFLFVFFGFYSSNFLLKNKLFFSFFGTDSRKFLRNLSLSLVLFFLESF